MTDRPHWQQGQFIDMPKYAHMSEEWKAARRAEEALLVRPSPTGNAICWCPDPETAVWIAERLRLADRLEQEKDNAQRA